MKNDPYVVSAFLNARELNNQPADGTNPFVTISRQYGADGEAIALRAGEILTEMSRGQQPWIVVDQDLGERVIEDHHLPKRIDRFFSGEQILTLEDHIEGIMGISVPGVTMIEKLTLTILQLAQIGHVILVGRAAHVIAAKFPRGLHVRVIGSFDRRVQRVEEARSCSRSEAIEEIRRVDHRRQHFVSTYFRSDLEDAKAYDMILNTDRISVEDGARTVAQLIASPEFGEKAAAQLRELRHLVLG
jgi:hypothetical protein